MILTDTSVWVEIINGRMGYALTDERIENLAITGPILQEVLQGVRSEMAAASLTVYLEEFQMLADPIAKQTFLHAAGIYRLGRRKGYTIRSTTDCLIAAIAIENSVPVWHRDRDFGVIARFTPLQAITSLSRPS